ncbi:hypothetical protein D3C87_469960 [compost metagenome]
MTAVVLMTAIWIGGCTGYSSNNREIPLELTAFNSLSDQEQDRIPVSPKDSVVVKVRVHEELAVLIGEQFNGKEVYSITFKHTGIGSSKDIQVYVDLDKHTILGKEFPNEKLPGPEPEL